LYEASLALDFFIWSCRTLRLSIGKPATYNNWFETLGRVISLAREPEQERRGEQTSSEVAKKSRASERSRDSERNKDRYSRQILFRGIGAEGQQKVSAARVALVGCGATGSALAGLLARAGVGTLRIIDRDYVEPSNLQRQSLFSEHDAAESLPKAIAAARQIATFNSDIVVDPKVADLVPANIEALLEGTQLILDGTDNFETRYLINDYAVDRSLPWIYSAAVGSYAVTLNVLPGQTACLACIFPDSPRGMVETCETSGILNSAVNLVASIAATEALKYLVGAQAQMRRTLLSFDVWTNEHAEISAAKPRARLHSPGWRRPPAHHVMRQEFRANP
jgi:adenylyltransferase/sulfurtransferase